MFSYRGVICKQLEANAQLPAADGRKTGGTGPNCHASAQEWQAQTGLARFQLSNPKVLETAHFIDSTRTITTTPASATLAISENKSCHG
jgi:hypothetical protein